MKVEQLIGEILSAPAERHNDILKAARGAADRKPQPLTAKQACEILGCCTATLRRMERRGVIAPRRLSKRMLRYERTEIEALLEIASV